MTPEQEKDWLADFLRSDIREVLEAALSMARLCAAMESRILELMRVIPDWPAYDPDNEREALRVIEWVAKHGSKEIPALLASHQDRLRLVLSLPPEEARSMIRDDLAVEMADRIAEGPVASPLTFQKTE